MESYKLGGKKIKSAIRDVIFYVEKHIHVMMMECHALLGCVLSINKKVLVPMGLRCYGLAS